MLPAQDRARHSSTPAWSRSVPAARSRYDQYLLRDVAFPSWPINSAETRRRQAKVYLVLIEAGTRQMMIAAIVIVITIPSPNSSTMYLVRPVSRVNGVNSVIPSQVEESLTLPAEQNIMRCLGSARNDKRATSESSA